MKMRICSVPGCEKPGRARGLCHGHYKRLLNYGSTDVKRGSKVPISERFWLYVEKRSKKECWLWTASKRGAGYGRIKENRRTFPAHRVSYELHFGKIPKGLLVCHKCDTPSCVNPNHLFVGTQKDNLADRKKKGRFHPVNGERHGWAKLTASQVKAIRIDRRSNPEISADYGVTPSNIRHIKVRKSWRHVA